MVAVEMHSVLTYLCISSYCLLCLKLTVPFVHITVPMNESTYFFLTRQALRAQITQITQSTNGVASRTPAHTCLLA